MHDTGAAHQPLLCSPPTAILGSRLAHPSHDRADADVSYSHLSGASDARAWDDNIQDCCYICLDGSTDDNALTRPCKCPRLVHAKCLALMQVHAAGKRNETNCEFCCQELPDWKMVLQPASRVPAKMNVTYKGKAYSFDVQPGPDGLRKFEVAVCRAFDLPEHTRLNISFKLDVPILKTESRERAPGSCVDDLGTRSLVQLSGRKNYDTAVHCAAISTAEYYGSDRKHHGNDKRCVQKRIAVLLG
eukprot:gene31089-6216_t